VGQCFSILICQRILRHMNSVVFESRVEMSEHKMETERSSLFSFG
jgi:hypothetical protein